MTVQKMREIIITLVCFLCMCTVIGTCEQFLKLSVGLSLGLVFGLPFVKRFALCYRIVVCPVLSVCDIGVLWTSDWMELDET